MALVERVVVLLRRTGPDDMQADDTARSTILAWKVISIYVLIICMGHLAEEARGYGWTWRTFPNHWQYIYRFADTSVALAFATLTCWIIWFSRNNLVTFLMASALGLLNWGENELKSRAFFGAFLETIDWWQWAAIDATLAVLVAIFLKPVIRQTTPHGTGIRALSIADLFLATFASAVLLVATRSIATLPFSPDNPQVLFCGWPQTLNACVTGVLMGAMAAAIVYLLIAGTWKRGLLAFIGTCVAYLGISQIVVTSNGRIAVKDFELSDGLFSPRDPLAAVFMLFAAAMLAVRYRRQPRPTEPTR
jgi:hypothetical protein